MGCRVMWGPEDDAACLYDSTTETVFGKRFLGDAAEKLEAFLQWCLKEHGDPRKLPVERVCALQDEWLAALDDGCEVCGAPPWEPCDEMDGPHERRFTRCAGHENGCRRAARLVAPDGKTWCSGHAPRGCKAIPEPVETGAPS